MTAFLNIYSRLCRFPIAAYAAYSALTGYLLASPASFSNGLVAVVSIFVLSAGASALNQYQEHDSDARMDRTKQRPLPSGALSRTQAHAFALMLIFCGLALLSLLGKAAFILGVCAAFWYNGVYTKLKRLTAFAAVPGALVGMAPPAIGWVAAGGGLMDPRLLVLCFVFFVWQVPHFWLQVLHHGEEYELAGLPSLTRLLAKKQIARITFAWICSAAASPLLLPVLGAIRPGILNFLLLPAGIWIVAKGYSLITPRFSPDLALSAFRVLNGYVMVLMSVVIIQGVFPKMP